MTKMKPMTVILICSVPEEHANQRMRQQVSDGIAEELKKFPLVLHQETLVTFRSPMDGNGGAE